MKTWHEYYRDKNKIEVVIKYTIKLPSVVENFNIDDHPMHIRQEGGEVHVNYHKEITRTLFNDLMDFFTLFREGKPIPEELLKKSPSKYIVGYLSETIPRVNYEILARKYKEGHILLRPISQFDIHNVFIVDKSGNYCAISWPSPLPKFPGLNKFETELEVIFVRDLIEAMTEYFYFNIEECIRRVITSLENYFIYYKLKPVVRSNFFFKLLGCRKNYKFKNLVIKFIVEIFYTYKDRDLKILRDNILFVYKIRNLIVHDKLRPGVDNMIFCYKAIMTLLYIYQSELIRKDNKYEYIFDFHMQFKMIANMIIGLNLDRFGVAEKYEKKSGILKTQDDVDHWIFSNLKITKREKRMIKKS